MTWFTGLMLYLVIWWTVLFAVLPWGVKPSPNPEPGHAPSAPEHPRLGRKALITTLLAAVIWLIAYVIITSDLLPVRHSVLS